MTTQIFFKRRGPVTSGAVGAAVPVAPAIVPPAAVPTQATPVQPAAAAPAATVQGSMETKSGEKAGLVSGR